MRFVLLAVQLLLISTTWVEAQTLQPGNEVGLENGQRYEVTQYLGKGNFKYAYKAKRLQPPCAETHGCWMTLYEQISNERRYKGDADSEIQRFHREDGGSPYLRREIGPVKIDGYPNKSFLLAEYVEYTADQIGDIMNL